MSKSSTDSSLLHLVQAHEADAWRKFVELYGPHVFAWARRFGLSADDAADVTQETFAAVAAAIGEFRHKEPGSSLRGWLWTIVRNKVRDLARRHDPGGQGAGGTSMHQQLMALPEQPPEECDPEESHQLSELVQRALAQVQGDFEPRTWQAFWQAVVEGRETSDVAKDLGMTANHVRQCRSRVLRRLREHLGE